MLNITREKLLADGVILKIKLQKEMEEERTNPYLKQV